MLDKEKKEIVNDNNRFNLNVTLPFELIDRIENYAKEQKTTTASILIEALDAFLRNRKK